MTRVRPAQDLQTDLHVPVAIVGAGACGLSAAIHLADLGVEAWVFERDAQASGSTALSSGFVPAAGTLAQQAAGVADSVADFMADIQTKAHGQAAAHLVAAYAQAIVPALDRLQTQHGFAWEILDGFLYPGHRARRMHSLPQRQGQALVHALLNRAQALGVPVVTQALVRDLFVDEQGRVVGLAMLRPDGQVESVGCEALLLACNGYGGDAQLIAQHVPQMAEAVFAGHTGNDGSAVKWGMQLGAGLADMSAYQGHGSWAMPHGALVSWALMMEGGVQVNCHGLRFHNETLGYSEAAEQVVAQPEAIAWCVFDAAIMALAQGFPDFVELQAAGGVLRADDAGELAARMGVPESALRDSIGVAPGQPDAFGRVFQRSLQAPFFAVRVTGALFHTQGGLDIDANARVRWSNGQPLPNLWAGGGAARGVSGPDVSGYLSGNGLLSALAGAWLAAQDISTHIQGTST